MKIFIIKYLTMFPWTHYNVFFGGSCLINKKYRYFKSILGDCCLLFFHISCQEILVGACVSIYSCVYVCVCVCMYFWLVARKCWNKDGYHKMRIYNITGQRLQSFPKIVTQLLPFDFAFASTSQSHRQMRKTC